MDGGSEMSGGDGGVFEYEEDKTGPDHDFTFLWI